jgi:hypothetical protein
MFIQTAFDFKVYRLACQTNDSKHWGFLKIEAQGRIGDVQTLS